MWRWWIAFLTAMTAAMAAPMLVFGEGQEAAAPVSLLRPGTPGAGYRRGMTSDARRPGEMAGGASLALFRPRGSSGGLTQTGGGMAARSAPPPSSSPGGGSGGELLGGGLGPMPGGGSSNPLLGGLSGSLGLPASSGLTGAE